MIEIDMGDGEMTEERKNDLAMMPALVADSCCDLNEDLEARVDVAKAPFPITLNDVQYQDDGSMDIQHFIQEIAKSPEIPKTAGPSPSLFMDAIGSALDAFIVTISGKLSGTYSNAKLAAEEIMHEAGRRVHVFDSKSASGGETAVIMKLKEWIDEKLDFDDIVRKGEDFISNLRTYFVLEDLGTLIKSGRIPKLAGSIATRLSIVPICSGNDGNIKVNEVRRGIDKALKRLSDIIVSDQVDFSDRTLYITHVNNEPRAEKLKSMIMDRVSFKEVQILSSGGLSTTYANDGGIIVAY